MHRPQSMSSDNPIAEQYPAKLADSIDRERYATLVQSVGDQLNGRKVRFDKSDIIERSLQVYSNGRLKWVDDEGRDFVDMCLDMDIEFKYQKDALFTNVRKDPRNPNLRVVNNLGEKNEMEPDALSRFLFSGTTKRDGRNLQTDDPR